MGILFEPYATENEPGQTGVKVHPNGTKKQYTPVSQKSNGRHVSIHPVIPVEKDARRADITYPHARGPG